MDIFIDIETIPSQDPIVKQAIVDAVKPPGNIKKPESIDKWMAENAETVADEEWRKTALNGTLGEIICISWAIDDEEPQVVSRTLDQPESELLVDFYHNLNSVINQESASGTPITIKPRWIGHYITGFDLRFIWQRSVIFGVRPPFSLPYDAKPWDETIYDTKTSWTGLKSTGSGTLDAICKALGLDGKGDDIDGSQVWDYIQAGRYDEVNQYCKDDVERTRALYRRMTFKDVG